jgi:hypothetical protein
MVALAVCTAGLVVAPTPASAMACPPDPQVVCGTDGDDTLVIDLTDDNEVIDRFIHVLVGPGDDTVCIV